jgi:hypothetical protein
MQRHIRTLIVRGAMLLLALVSMPIARPARAADQRCFAETKQCISGRFRDYWEQNGGLAVFGFPTTPARDERNRDTGKTYLTQYFERNRFELHPEKTAPYDVLLGRLGDDQLLKHGYDWRTAPRERGPVPGCLWFKETGHNVCDVAGGLQFKTYWQSHGVQDAQLNPYGKSLALFGYPLTDVRMETNSSGYLVFTQWFERARFEWHPDRPTQPTRYTVRLGLLGNEIRKGLEALIPGDLKRARDTLLSYFAALHGGRYGEAVQYYGGSYETLRNWNGDLPAPKLFEGGCKVNGLQCLPVRRIVSEKASSAREFQFVVEFSNADGSLFRRGPCCGASEKEMPTQWQWPYIVTKIGDQFLVQGLPVYVP